MSDSSVQFKGVNGDLLLSLDWAEPLDSLLEQLDAQLKESDNFFSGSKVILELGAKTLTLADVQSFQNVLTRYSLVLHALRGVAPEGKTAAAVEPSISARAPVTRRRAAPSLGSAPEPEMDPAPEPVEMEALRERKTARILRRNAHTSPADPRGPTRTLLVKRTLRAGQVLNHAGSIIVIGDVNPGAEVVAGHDIVVWGSLRGTACAGVAGDTQATIHALHMAPSQLRIADHITRSPRESLLASEDHDLQPEVARIENATIVVEYWNTKKGLPAKDLSRVHGLDGSEKNSKE